ncbi:beta-lactamase/transpeptidase-like protein [Bombardia bombarda]|uniref:Beta-lactamase/transpeptidase-like protein n=1 Tax=Bombardia bombarda TaxID=252184 RepID=A0AA39X6U2_9PEZI|nr:beta-lactamase/transpeptidase-like protein [Bombardia bombarda]
MASTTKSCKEKLPFNTSDWKQTRGWVEVNSSCYGSFTSASGHVRSYHLDARLLAHLKVTNRPKVGVFYGKSRYLMLGVPLVRIVFQRLQGRPLKAQVSATHTSGLFHHSSLPPWPPRVTMQISLLDWRAPTLTLRNSGASQATPVSPSGVLRHGHVIYRANFGYRDMEAKIAPDSDTTFYIASMSKAMAANALTSLVKDGKVSLETKLADLVPEYRDASDNVKYKELATEATLLNLMAHRLGITAGNNFWLQKGAKVLVDKSETAKIVGFLQPLVPFRSSFMYSNWGYGLLGEIMESVSGEDLESLFQRTLFKPLGLERSSLEAIAGEWKNVTKCYQALSDATPYEIPPKPYHAGSARAAAGAVKSTVNELLHLYGAWMAAAKDQASTGQAQTPGSPFTHVSAQWTPHNKVTEESDYGPEWVLTNLPAKVSITSLNPFEGPKRTRSRQGHYAAPPRVSSWVCDWRTQLRVPSAGHGDRDSCAWKHVRPVRYARLHLPEPPGSAARRA